MKDINIEKGYMKLQYIIAWIGFILLGFVIMWIIALAIAQYKDTDKNNKKGVLNKTHQKLIFWYGSIVGDIFLIMLIIDLVQMIFTGTPM